jgi:AbrB family looped-hinge helix DNA binding protein
MEAIMSKGFSESSQPPIAAAELFLEADAPLHAMLRVGPGGRVVIPADMREAMGLEQGDGLMATMDGKKLVLESLMDRFRELHAITARYHPEGVSLVDEFLAEKRAEQAKEDAESAAELAEMKLRRGQE